MTTKDHYDNHLADLYEWMSGDFDIKRKEQQVFFEQHNIFPPENKIAIDLGAGHGLQSISLANLGFSVKAIDFNKKLLHDLSKRSADLDIEIIEADILDLNKFVKSAGLIVCMGDTMSHIESTELLHQLIERCYHTLQVKGKLILSFRDYSTELEDTTRIIPVRSDNEKIFTCLLEYFKDKIRVTDMLYYKSGGSWQFKASSYMKLRISADLISTSISESGFKVLSTDTINGMVYIISSK